MNSNNHHRKILSLRERLSHASGALTDIAVSVTSEVREDSSEEIKEFAKSILLRILGSADTVRSKPSFYTHEFEEELFERYFAGDIKIGSGQESCLEVARELEVRSSREEPKFEKK